MNINHWINGRAESSTNSRTLPVVNPATGDLVAETPAGTPEDVDKAVAAARAAFPAWAATSPAERIAVVRRLAAELQARTERIATAITAEMGAPTTLSRAAQAAFPVLVAESMAGVAETFAWSERIGTSLVVHEPIGVVGAITPWNFPLQQMMSKVAPALLAGNTVVAKPAEGAPLTIGILAEAAKEAGLPDGVLNVVYGEGPVVGEAIAAHPDVDMVSFTGSTRAGRRIGAVAAVTVKRVTLELGGKGAHVLLDDADFATAVAQSLGHVFINGGQVCGSWPRLLVPAGRQDEVVGLAVEAARTYVVGDPRDETTGIGPMASEAHRERVEAYIQRGIADGATLVYGGPGRPEGWDKGAYVRPTIFADVDPGSVIAQEEIFGPVLTIIPYADEDEAVAIANATVYGLTSGVSGEPEHALAVARRLRAGQVDVNGGDWNPLAPFGGYKQSGNGREFGRDGLREFVETKAIQL
ncbi:aldehyde dehydrogenase family protein [Actinoplanes sp. TBRC 11911]|uniref:aldehyde dehydrogenase family protein n=1 Tax=Actinoplanes sp. TBRC 11911 TaxID=2729386 RepID=UPI00145DE825|nr:aldehyde dehydrogenase family protein [Actinoplanes sp. TBRC 11911]NMO56923.1 aldehyde dehydrogenase family protein [Actinoplanes sp. TBRC 11911]